MKIETKFDLKEIVRIKELNLKGRISSIEFNLKGTRYCVDYFANGEIKLVWLFEEDIEKQDIK